jgi:vitamin B12 transporter
MLTRSTNLAYFSCTVALLGLSLQTEGAEELPALTVMGQETANQRPVTTYETPISNLDFDPRVDMISRNMVETQGDINIRGGIFEDTGIQLGSATLLDPLTGHYSTELPIAPEMLGEPKVLTGADNAFKGFNSNAGTISYSWSEITKGGSLTVGGGDHNLNFQRIHHALTGSYGNSNDWTWGAEIEGSRSESDGTIPDADHSMERTSGRFQLLSATSQTDLVFGYQDKFFGLPGMYSGAPTSYLETEDIQTRLLLLNHYQQYDSDSYWESSIFFRRVSDHWIGKRENPSASPAKHETKIKGIGISGFHSFNEQVALNFSSQISSDEIVTTNAPPYHDRDYYKFSIVPQYEYSLSNTETVTTKLGASFDDSNRDPSKISPIAEIRWKQSQNISQSKEFYLSYAESSQVLGYTPLSKGDEFNGDDNLKRGVSKNLEVGYILTESDWKLSGAIFKRWDDDLVDWIYSDKSGSEIKYAKHVNLETIGLELIASKSWQNLEAIGSYAFLKKNEDYGDPSIKRSVYALNFPEHRVTLGMIWNHSEFIQFRVDNEWRKQKENIDRRGPNESTYSHFAASFYPPKIDHLEIFIAFEKPWNEDFQDIPKTPGRSDQFSFGATYSW